MRTGSVAGLGVALLAFVTACNTGGTAPGPTGSAGPAPASKPVSLNGAGATFPYPLYSKWMSEYGKLKPNVRLNYQSIGSGGGVRQVVARTVDFGASDAPMTAEEAAQAPSPIVHLPTTIGAVAIAFQVAGLPELRLTSAAIVAIFLGQVKRWNAPEIASANPGVALPDSEIAVVTRSDGSGTTAVFTDYLGKVSPEWVSKVGVGKSVKWPVGLSAKGNEGVTGQVKTTPSSVGYVELAYAKQNGLAVAAVQNASGAFVAPSIEGVTAAAAAVEMPDTLHVSITNATGAASYPIAAYTYLLVYEDTPVAEKGRALAGFVQWAIREGQAFAAPLHYAPLPASVVTRVEARLRSLKSGGVALLPGG